MDAPQDTNPPLKRGIHPLRLLLIIVLAVLTFPLIAYGLFIVAYLLIAMPNGFD